MLDDGELRHRPHNSDRSLMPGSPVCVRRPAWSGAFSLQDIVRERRPSCNRGVTNWVTLSTATLTATGPNEGDSGRKPADDGQSRPTCTDADGRRAELTDEGSRRDGGLGILPDVTYDLAVWEGSQPADDAAAGTTFQQLYGQYLGEESSEVPPNTTAAL
jgi:hypothetical protein